MKREFLLNILFLLAVNLLIKPFYLFGIDRTVQNTVEEGAYGLYFTLLNFAYLFQIINDFGLQNYNNRNIAQHRHLLDKYTSHLLSLKLLLGILYLAAVVLGAWLAGYGAAVLPLLAWIAFNWFLTGMILYLRSNISGLGHYRLDSLLSVLDKLLLIGLMGALLWGPWRGGFRIEWFVYAQTLALLLTLATAFAVVYRALSSFRLRFKPAFARSTLRQSAPYALVIFLMTAYTRIDGVMIERLLADGLAEAGRYASAYRLLDAASMVGYLFAVLLLPMFARMLKVGEPVAGLVGVSFRLIWVGAVTLAAAVWPCREPLMRLLYTQGNAYSGDILGWLMVSFAAVCGSYIYGTLLTANGQLREMNLLFAFSLLLNVLLNAALIPTHQALGAAQATCATQFFVFFAQVYLAWRTLGLPAGGGAVLRPAAFAAGMWGAGMALSGWGLSWPLVFGLTGVAGACLAVLTGLLQRRDVAAIGRLAVRR